MRKNRKKILSTLLIIIISTFIGINSYAHSGRTDSSGGHKDNKTSTSTTSSNTKSTSTPVIIEVTGIQINEDIKSIDIGENKNLTATITPNNATNKSIEWKSSDESIVTITTNGKITAKKSGVVNITASSSNGKTSTIKIIVNEEENSSNIISTSAIISSGTNSNNTNNKVENSSNAIGGITAIGLLSGGSYLGYRKYKKSK